MRTIEDIVRALAAEWTGEPLATLPDYAGCVNIQTGSVLSYDQVYNLKLKANPALSKMLGTYLALEEFRPALLEIHTALGFGKEPRKITDILLEAAKRIRAQAK